MELWRKLVAAGALVTVLLVPFLALAACAPASGSMPGHACCRMMARMAAATASRTSVHSGEVPPCCQFKSSRPAPVTEPETVSPQSSSLALTAAIERSVPVFASVSIVPDVAAPPGADRQARLCTLLI